MSPLCSRATLSASARERGWLIQLGVLVEASERRGGCSAAKASPGAKASKPTIKTLNDIVLNFSGTSTEGVFALCTKIDLTANPKKKGRGRPVENGWRESG